VETPLTGIFLSHALPLGHIPFKNYLPLGIEPRLAESKPAVLTTRPWKNLK
tara:strand:- start:787 stop:939 length:153 start_codon:yes stop_codon:yes gene_type:complete